mmetsp:Transcript_19718/g.47858  ORF Transcript_19718/g.47858 Transcript_19718/m.47858 type:complete len:283 (+) Transcript_19718:1188-2036(+)
MWISRRPSKWWVKTTTLGSPRMRGPRTSWTTLRMMTRKNGRRTRRTWRRSQRKTASQRETTSRWKIPPTSLPSSSMRSWSKDWPASQKFSDQLTSSTIELEQALWPPPLILMWGVRPRKVCRMSRSSWLPTLSTGRGQGIYSRRGTGGLGTTATDPPLRHAHPVAKHRKSMQRAQRRCVRSQRSVSKSRKKPSGPSPSRWSKKSIPLVFQRQTSQRLPAHPARRAQKERMAAVPLKTSRRCQAYRCLWSLCKSNQLSRYGKIAKTCQSTSQWTSCPAIPCRA